MDYERLKNVLMQLSENSIQYTLDMLSTLVDDNLSEKSLLVRKSRFSNGDSNKYSSNWRSVGFVAKYDVEEDTVTFYKEGTEGAPKLKKKKDPNAFVLNRNLPKDIELDAKGHVKITHQNWEKINQKIYNSDAYRYVGAFAPFLFEATKPSKPQNIELKQIISRLVIIDEIDSVNIGKPTGLIECIAKDILETGLEELIANKKPISNDIFKKIARRQRINPKKKGKKTYDYFSAVTKYISRSAQFIYGNPSGYPIYDSVLEKHLHFYIPGIDHKQIGKLKNACDYQGYCKLVNDYLESINKKNKKNQQINNVMFDQIVWYSYKTPNAPKKLK